LFALLLEGRAMRESLEKVGRRAKFIRQVLNSARNRPSRL
jgi:hypothetical protein